MECEKIKELIPRYFNHTASEEEIKMVEEHLCVCHDCRTVLGELMDREAEASTSDSTEAGAAGVRQASTEGQPEQMQIFSYDDIANIPQGSQPVSDNIQPEEEPIKSEPQEETPSELKIKKDMEYFPAKDFEDILKKPPEPVEGCKPDETSPSPQTSSPMSGLDRQSDAEQNKDKIIQTPLGPMPVSSDDEAPEAEDELPPEQTAKANPPASKDLAKTPEKKENIIQTPLGPISLSSEDEGISAEQGISGEFTEKEDFKQNEIRPESKEIAYEKFKVEAKPSQEKIPAVPSESVVNKEEEIQEIETNDFSSKATPKFELDKTPISSDKTDIFGYAIVVIAVIALLFVVYLFLQIKG